MLNDPQTVHARRGEVQILDVRELYEWDAGHIEGAIHIPLNDVLAGKEQGRLDPGKPVVVVCKTGNRSELATLMLQARGYDAHNLEGGTERWVASGLPIVASDGSPGWVA
ncbi:MAG TPA: rhodanese-like domain-containing protein [Actinomycetota bacterium]|nr:rhodanese-like domain-containing protein [Actinomycetota bacterium]